MVIGGDIMRIVIGLNSSWNILNFRSGLVRGLIDAGHEVVAIAPEDEYSDRVRALGCQVVPIKLSPSGRNPILELKLFVQFVYALYLLKPNVFLPFTVKPNIYGSIAARIVGAKTVNNIAGLGIVFGKRTVFTRFIEVLYRVALSGSIRVFFQNNEDLSLFVSREIVPAKLADRLPGSGVDLKKFPFTAMPSRCAGKPFRFLLVARMLWSKGVEEYVRAARAVKSRYPEAEFVLVGFSDVSNPDAIPIEILEGWAADGDVTYLGSTNSVYEVIAASDCVVLPSYYPEGVPRSLLESAAVGRPIITTDTPGCREVVIHGENGFLCRVKDVDDLASKMVAMLGCNQEVVNDMSRSSRLLVERAFDERIVISRYLEVINEAGRNGG